MTGDSWGLGELDVPEDELVFNGVDVDTGTYLFPRAQLDSVARAARGEQEDRAHAADLRARGRADTEDVLAVVYGRSPERLAEAGWALIAADDVEPEILEALTPLRDRRRQQAGALYRELCGPAAGVHAGESSQDFLVRHDVDPHDVADPSRAAVL